MGWADGAVIHRVLFGGLKLLHSRVEVAHCGRRAKVSDIGERIDHKANSTAEGGGERIDDDLDGVAPKSYDLMRKVCQQDARGWRGGRHICGTSGNRVVRRPQGLPATREALNGCPLCTNGGVGNPRGC